MRALRRHAVSARPPVFVIVGTDGREAADGLRLDPRIRTVPAPRQANVLVIVGRLTEPLLAAAIAAHDVVPEPRCVVEWRPRSTSGTASTIPGSEVATGPDVATTITAAHTAVLSGERGSTPTVRADAEPAPWRGVGPYGQGGSGMTGGVPYGRPMAEREDDRDGLTLDALPVEIGPLFSAFPDGLTARVTFQGDLVHRFELGDNPFASRPPEGHDDPFVRALTQPQRIADLEIERARALLRWAAGALRLHGLHALSLRVLRIAVDAGPGDAAAVRRLRRWITRSPVTGRQLRNVGAIERRLLEGLGVGPVGRAAGLPDDGRADDPRYGELGFAPVIGGDNDARGRLRQRLAEAEQALDLAGRAGDRLTGGQGVVESPRGRLETGDSPTERLFGIVPELVTGLEWGDAVTALTSLDLDLREDAAVRPARTVG